MSGIGSSDLIVIVVAAEEGDERREKRGERKGETGRPEATEEGGNWTASGGTPSGISERSPIF